ncbi:MAG: Crp/Fnr family transcriptional regulator [Bacteroidales bacterium]|jgi:CRP/FNR family transcriptional regulator|nr:Crp/Fnr family transcriptional regulator [Bacteroidales bacterium]MDD4384464.1 Crp/Fnr family transcriptional regulator [Bacteroidales bacterium]MDY0196817.1 Crp/Fnr family transcriptional regulator [Tenuifilaceae bacterium]
MNQSQRTEENFNDPQLLPFESVLLPEERAKLYSATNKVEYGKRDLIIKQNARVSEIPLVLSGLVKISREMRRGKNVILRIAQPGSFLGLSSIFGSDVYEYSVFALESVTVRFVDIETFRWLIQKNGLFAMEVVKQLSTDNIFNINRLSSLLYKQLPGRVADIILYFSEDIFKNNTFTIPLTRQELAELAGTTKESLIRTLSEFKHDKIIDMNRNFFQVNSMHIVKTLSRLG